jgi:hypothetical protein
VREDGLARGAELPGFTGKMFWQVGHLIRAPEAGIFLSSMLRVERHDGQETFMGHLRPEKPRERT